MREGEEEETLSSELDDNITSLGGQTILPPKLLPLCGMPMESRTRHREGKVFYDFHHIINISSLL
jgi:hypothetical protein